MDTRGQLQLRNVYALIQQRLMSFDYIGLHAYIQCVIKNLCAYINSSGKCVYVCVGSEQPCSGGGDNKRSTEGAGFMGRCSYLQPYRVHRQQQPHSDPHQGLERYSQPGRHMDKETFVFTHT